MKIAGKVAVVTGGAGGIGKALVRRLVREGAKAVVLADSAHSNLAEAAAVTGGRAMACDVTRESDVRALVAATEDAFGPIDIFISNAGAYVPGDEDASDALWAGLWNLHVMAHVYAARALMPTMAARGGAAFIVTASAAGLLSHISSAPYAVTKNAAIAFAEYLAIEHGDSDVQVAVLCPQRVRTPMTDNLSGSASLAEGMIEPEELATSVVQALESGQFLILPHPVVLEYLQRKTADYDRWLRGMRKVRANFRKG